MLPAKSDKKSTIYSIMADYDGAYAWLAEEGYRTQGVGSNISDSSGWYGDHPISDALHDAFAQWQRAFEMSDVYDETEACKFDWPVFHEKGLKLSQQLKAELGDHVLVVYVKPFEDPNHEKNERTEILSDGTLLPLPGFL